MKARPLSILVVDDEWPIVKSIASVLERRGHAVGKASTAEEALGFPPPDVLVADVGLNGPSGLDLLAAWKARGVLPRTIFITGAPSVDTCRRAFQLGAAEFLVKPFRLDDLVRAIESPSAFASTPSSSDPLHGYVRECEGTWYFERAYSSQSLSVERAARDISAFAMRCGIGPSARARIASATSEIVDNACRHGYAAAPGDIHVTGESDGREISVRVRDEGAGFETSRLPSSALDTPRFHGLARALALTEHLELDTALGKGTSVLLRFTVFRVDFDEGPSVDLSELDFLTPDLSRRVLQALREADTKDFFQISPALAVVIGRLLAGPDRQRSLEAALWS